MSIESAEDLAGMDLAGSVTRAVLNAMKRRSAPESAPGSFGWGASADGLTALVAETIWAMHYAGAEPNVLCANCRTPWRSAVCFGKTLSASSISITEPWA